MATNDPTTVRKVAADVKSEPYAYTDLARQYVEQDTQLNPLAFGAIGMAMLLSSYNPSRQQQLENLRAACSRIEEMANGLARVAANWEGADYASTPVGRKDLTTYVPPDGGSYGRHIGQAALMAVGWGAVKLLPLWLSCKRVAGEIGKLERLALPMVGLWALCQPFDDDIDRAIGAWNAAKTQLDVVPGEFERVLAPLAEAWEGTDKEAFDAWLRRFLPEFGDASQAAGKTAETLNNAKTTIVFYQTSFFVFTMTVLVTMISLMVAETLPYIGPFAKAMKKVLALVAVAGTAGMVAGIANALNASLTALPGLMQAGQFGELAINVGGGGVGFADVRTDWDDRLERIRMV